MSAPLLFEARGPEFVALRAGEFVKGGRKVRVTADDLTRAEENFARWRDAGQAVVVDFDHSFASGGSSRAAGWIESLRRSGDRLLARVAWTEKAREALESDEFRFFSPEFSPSHRDEYGNDEGFTIVSGALTNRPFLRGMTRVAFSDERSAEIDGLRATTDALAARSHPRSVAMGWHALDLMEADPGLDYIGAVVAAEREMR